MRAIKSNRFIKTTFLYTVSSFCNSATPFILLPILTRYLSTSEYGTISMFNATSSILLPFMGMGISAAVLRKMADKRKDDDPEYIFNASLVLIVASLIVISVVLLARDYFSYVTSINQEYIWFVLIYTINIAVCELMQTVLQINEKVKCFFVYQNCGTLLNLIVSIILVVKLKMGLRGRIYGLFFPKLIFALFGLFYIQKYIGIKPRINKTYIKDVVFNYGIPLVPTKLKSTVLTYTDKIFIANMLSVSSTGIYSVGNQLSMPILILTQAFNLAYVPWLYKKLNEESECTKKKIVNYTYIYFVAIILIALVWSLVAGLILPYIAGEGYQSASMYIIWLSLAYALTGMHMMVVNYIYYTKQTRLYAVVTIMVIFVNIILNYFFIKTNGAVGAAQATFLSDAVSFGLTWFLASKVYKMPWKLKNRRSR